MRFLHASSVLAVFALALPGALAQPPVDIQTSFEFEETDGRFIIGQCPGCAVFSNGVASEVPDPQLAIFGNHAWMVSPGATGVITFEVPARNVTFFFKDETAAVQSVLTFKDVNGNVLQTMNGSAAGPETNGFTKVEVTNSSVKTITLENKAPATTPAVVTVIENLIATFNETPALVLVDTFFFPRFADGRFAGNNSFITEAMLTNAGDFVQLKLGSFDDQGEPLTVTLEDKETQNRTTDSSFIFELQPGASVGFTTVGLGNGTPNRDLISGYWRVEVRRLEGQQVGQSAKVEGVAVFSRLQGEEGNQVLVFETGIPSTRQLGQFTLFLDTTDDRDTGLALVSSPEATSPNNITLSVWDMPLEQKIASATFTLEPGESVSKFIWEYIQQFGQNVTPQLLETLQETRGVVQVTSEAGTAPMVLRQNHPFGVFPEIVPTLTTIPVVGSEVNADQ